MCFTRRLVRYRKMFPVLFLVETDRADVQRGSVDVVDIETQPVSLFARIREVLQYLGLACGQVERDGLPVI